MLSDSHVHPGDPVLNNEESKENGRHYKKGFALLPAVVYVGDGMGPANFKICGCLSEFISVCQVILLHNEYISKRAS